MKRLLLATALLLCSGGVPFYADEKPAVEKKTPAPADAPSLKLPATVTGDPGDFIEITAETNGNAVAWRVVDKGLKLFPVSRLKDTKTAIVTSNTSGSYRVWAVTAIGGVPSEIAECVVVVGTPTPPIPPGPPVPPPTDLTATLQAAFNLDTDTDRAASLKTLTGLYQGLAVLATVKTDLHTNADALAWLSGVIQAPSTGLGTTKIQNTRKAIAARLSATFGNMPVSALDVKKFAAELKTIGDALGGLK